MHAHIKANEELLSEDSGKRNSLSLKLLELIPFFHFFPTQYAKQFKLSICCGLLLAGDHCVESEGREVGKPGPNDITGLLGEALPDEV